MDDGFKRFMMIINEGEIEFTSFDRKISYKNIQSWTTILIQK